MYYLGNLTIDRDDEYSAGIVFKIPNHIIKQMYWQYYAVVLKEQAQLDYHENDTQQAIMQAMRGNIEPFLRLVESVLEQLSNRDFRRFDEKYIKMLMIAFAMQGRAGRFAFRPNAKRQTAGYIGMELYRRPRNAKLHHQYVFEIKYIKKEDEVGCGRYRKR